MRTPTFQLALAGLPALASVLGTTEAATVNTSTAFSYSTSPSTVQDTNGGSGSASGSDVSAGSLTASSLSRFNSSQGVLTGVRLDLTSNQTLSVTGSVKRSSGSGTASISGASSSSARIRTGNSSSIDTGITDTAVNASSQSATSGNVTTTTIAQSLSASASQTTNSTQTIAANKLNNFVGAGTLSVGSASTDAVRLSWNPSELSANLRGSGLTSSNATSSLSWTGNVGFTYTYLQHADPSFNSASTDHNTLTLDFGNVQQNASVSPLNFSIANLAGDRTGLDFTSATGTGATSTLTTNLSAFNNLAQNGTTPLFAALFNTSTVGSFAATYTLKFRDTTGTGASASQFSSQTLTLNLLGNVSPVPVPAAVWLFGSAIAGLVGFARRNKPASTA